MISLPAVLRRIQAWLHPLAWALALLFAAWACATMFWQLTPPAQVTALPSHMAEPGAAAREILRALGSSGTATGARPPAQADYQLIGLATGFGPDPGFALLRKPDGETLAVLQDETLADGLRLARILPDRIELTADGHTVELRMRTPDSTDTAPRPYDATARAQTTPTTADASERTYAISTD
jgi:hypothetical protein